MHDNLEQIEAGSREFFNSNDKEWYKSGIKQLADRWFQTIGRRRKRTMDTPRNSQIIQKQVIHNSIVSKKNELCKSESPKYHQKKIVKLELG